MSREEWIFLANSFRSPTSGMAVNFSHQWGVSNWQAHQPNHICSSLLMIPAGNPTYLWYPSRSWASLGNIAIQPLGRLGAYIVSFQLGSGWMLLGFLMGPFDQGCPLFWVKKGHMSLPSMPTWGPLMPMQRPTPAAAVAAGALTLDASTSWLSLLIFNSNIWMATNTHWWASLAFWRALLCW